MLIGIQHFNSNKNRSFNYLNKNVEYSIYFPI